MFPSQRTGLLKMLDVECSVRGCPETYVQKVKVAHKENPRLFEPQHCDITRTFGIHHYAGRVVYDTTDFLGELKDMWYEKNFIILLQEPIVMLFPTIWSPSSTSNPVILDL